MKILSIIGEPRPPKISATRPNFLPSRSLFRPDIFRSAIAAAGLAVAILASAGVAHADILDAAAPCNPQQLTRDIAAGDNVSATDSSQNSVLHWAAAYGGDQCVEILLEHGAKLNARNEDGETPLMKAVISSASPEGSLRAARLLIDAGASISIPNEFGYSPLFALMVYGKQFEIIGDPEQLKPDPVTGIPPYRGPTYAMAKLLLDHGANAAEVDSHGQSIMQFAVELRTPAVVDLLAAHGGNLNARIPTADRTLLHWAALKNRPVMIAYLIKKGLDINAMDDAGGTPLMLAVANNKIEAVKALIAAGADMEKRDSRTMTPLIYAASKDDYEAAKLLLEAGANVNATTSPNKNSALMQAAYNGHKDMVALLLQHHADPNLKSAAGLTAEDYADYKKHSDIEALLRNAK